MRKKIDIWSTKSFPRSPLNEIHGFDCLLCRHGSTFLQFITNPESTNKSHFQHFFVLLRKLLHIWCVARLTSQPIEAQQLHCFCYLLCYKRECDIIHDVCVCVCDLLQKGHRVFNPRIVGPPARSPHYCNYNSTRIRMRRVTHLFSIQNIIIIFISSKIKPTRFGNGRHLIRFCCCVRFADRRPPDAKFSGSWFQ